MNKEKMMLSEANERGDEFTFSSPCSGATEGDGLLQDVQETGQFQDCTWCYGEGMRTTHWETHKMMVCPQCGGTGWKMDTAD